MRNLKRKQLWLIAKLLHNIIVIVGAAGLALVFFLVLPLMQTLAKPPTHDILIREVDVARNEPPPPPPEIEKEDEPEPQDNPPELTPDTTPVDLALLELALNPGFGDGITGGDFTVNLRTLVSAAGAKNIDELFSVGELDQTPRILYQPGPTWSKEMRKKAPGKVEITFTVDQQGRTTEPRIMTSSDPAFEKAALAAVKQWKFEPGKRNGQPVRFRMKQTFTFKGD